MLLSYVCSDMARSSAGICHRDVKLWLLRMTAHCFTAGVCILQAVCSPQQQGLLQVGIAVWLMLCKLPEGDARSSLGHCQLCVPSQVQSRVLCLQRLPILVY